MLEKERHNLILKLVEERSIVSVGDLLDVLGASEATIRRDIHALTVRGEVKRILDSKRNLHSHGPPAPLLDGALHAELPMGPVYAA